MIGNWPPSKHDNAALTSNSSTSNSDIVMPASSNRCVIKSSKSLYVAEVKESEGYEMLLVNTALI